MSLDAIPEGADVTWMEKGICGSGVVDPDLFFPSFDAPSSTAAAKAVCQRCPVRGECLDWAIRFHESGVWGETSEADRRTLARRKDRSVCVICESEEIMQLGGDQVCLGCGASWRS